MKTPDSHSTTAPSRKPPGSTKMPSSLYGSRDPNSTKSSHKPPLPTSSLTFTSTLSSLIASSKSKSSTNPGVRPTKSNNSATKSDIFSKPNKNVHKRKLADLNNGDNEDGHGKAGQSHRTKHDVGTLTSSELQRSKRKMEEKALLYKQMKRGEVLEGLTGESTGGGLVDFDRKWAEAQRNNGEDNQDRHDSDLDSDSDSNNSNDDTIAPATETVEYLDEFGRLRHGTPSEALRSQRMQATTAALSSTTNPSSNVAAHPLRPDNIILGDTIQHASFNPSHIIQSQMAALAAKRDREATPPEETHYDANWEVRTRGTGFYQFSKDAEGRKAEMAGLSNERGETERRREKGETAAEQISPIDPVPTDTKPSKTVDTKPNASSAKETAHTRRQQEINERRQKLEALRQQRREQETSKFLDGLDGELGGILPADGVKKT